ncbi:MAG: hypothetical protein JNM50_01945 [Chromatiales bacterium]|nr:hypothetical protein [Chromatiales bacterium]
MGSSNLLSGGRRPAAVAGLAAALLGCGALPAVAADIPPAFHGTWVRGDAACGAPLALLIAAKRVTFRNGGQARSFDRLEVCTNCGDPGDDSGTIQVLADAPDGSPFLLFLTPGAKPLVTMNWNPLEEQLVRTYPLAPEPLKRCGG